MQIGEFIRFKLPVLKSRVTIRKQLKRDGFIPIKNDKFWNELAEAYIRQKYKHKWIRANARHSKQEIAYKIKKRAEEVLDEEYSSENEHFYTLASKWCTVPHSIAERARHMGFSLLNMNDKNCPDDEIWIMRIMDYKPLPGELDLSESLSHTNSMERKVRFMKAVAKHLIRVKNYEENSEIAWNTVIRWFTKKRP